MTQEPHFFSGVKIKFTWKEDGIYDKGRIGIYQNIQKKIKN